MNIEQFLMALSISGWLAIWLPLTKKHNGGSKMGIDLKAIKQEYGVDQKAATEGKWFPLSMINGVEIKVAKTGNPIYEKAAKRLYSPYKERLRRQSLSTEVMERITNDLIVQALIKDWKGMPGENGKNVPYSQEEAKKLIEDPELKEIKEEILGFADDFQAFKLIQDEELEKN